ncbi:MAG: response regulator [Ignavibacteria bacterium]|jgi:CheY-like chemotaxis protein|nr:response regulator [Ignavibacteria bacterium]MDH7526906.1 response regulator [Ignavibacteria bacterium]NPV11745.1 response regulator [Ignavibacteria bacterium]
MKKTVLLVEDEKPIQVLITHHLGKLNYDVVVKETAEAAIEYLKKSNALPDLIITDVLLPGMNGINFCRLVKTDPKTLDIPVIILSSVDYDFYRQGAEASNADYFMTKPFRIKDFINIINKIITV